MILKRSRASLSWLPFMVIGLLAGSALSLRAEEQSGPRCTNKKLDGSYGFYRTGKGAFGGPLVGGGIATFDGNGNWTSVLTNVRDGDVSFDEEFEGTYTINTDCTGSLFVEGDELERLVIVDDGKGYYAVNVGGGATIYLVATRIHAGRSGDRDH